MEPAGTLEVEVTILDPRLQAWGLPQAQSGMAAALDLHACLDAPLVLPAGAPAVLVGAGFALHIADPGMAALVLPRSGLGHRHGLVLGNAVGLIDPDYAGPVLVSAWNRNPPGGAAITIAPGERFAQLLFVPVLRPRLRVVAAFTRPGEQGGRGGRGFGSTG